jgi:hypothetical protein
MILKYLLPARRLYYRVDDSAGGGHFSKGRIAEGGFSLAIDVHERQSRLEILREEHKAPANGIICYAAD